MWGLEAAGTPRSLAGRSDREAQTTPIPGRLAAEGLSKSCAAMPSHAEPAAWVPSPTLCTRRRSRCLPVIPHRGKEGGPKFSRAGQRTVGSARRRRCDRAARLSRALCMYCEVHTRCRGVSHKRRGRGAPRGMGVISRPPHSWLFTEVLTPLAPRRQARHYGTGQCTQYYVD